jgi:cell wall-associated NlpC family hydrolase
VYINRDAWQQAEQGEEIADPRDVRTGDVATLTSMDGRIYHAGLLLSPDRIIHASAQVRIDRFDSQGIYFEKEQRYTHKLLSIRRMAEVV